MGWAPCAVRHTTHDRRAVPLVVADERCEALLPAEVSHPPSLGGWHGPVLRNYWDGGGARGGDGGVMGGRVQYLPLGPRFEFPEVDPGGLFRRQGAGHAAPRRPRPRLFNMMASLDTHPDRAQVRF